MRSWNRPSDNAPYGPYTSPTTANPATEITAGPGGANDSRATPCAATIPSSTRRTAPRRSMPTASAPSTAPTPKAAQ
ncbi:hypothetical protein VR45_14965 [Streptomyces sp. NRRL S-495]|nr:hypothetical protein VR45_14965 [Streptomyces sp. NRRL S-495]